jgi:uncharacterized membrane protein YedE/YeeE
MRFDGKHHWHWHNRLLPHRRFYLLLLSLILKLNRQHLLQNKPKVEWEVMLVLGIVLGALLAATTGGELTGTWVPAMWAERFGDGLGLRLAVAFAGGAVMAFGARLAGGCTSGHGISGTLQLSVGSWIALACFFIGGAAVAMLMFGVGGAR